jgi:hypothetical protein|tara:strand:+ start:93 stop:629 length:537 start_codon:yes stop_codon:yes gene_type:complete
MKQVIASFIGHKDLYIISLTLGSIFTAITSFFIKYTPSHVFGVSITLWSIALIINLIDIHTGIKANSKLKKDLGEKFVFNSGKAWRGFEKIFVFTMIIWFIWELESEVIRLNYANILSSILLVIKFIMLIYVVLIEIQSIGENEFVRFGKKGKLFTLLDKIIEVVNEGILKRLKKIIE